MSINKVGMRKRILHWIKDSINEINTNNFYNNTFSANNIHIGNKSLSSIKSFPFMTVYLGQEKAIEFDESMKLVQMQAELQINVFIKSVENSVIESFTEDLLSFFEFIPNSNITVKSNLTGLKYVVSNNFQEITPVINLEKNTSILILKTNVNYLDVIDMNDINYLLAESGERFVTETNQKIILE